MKEHVAIFLAAFVSLTLATDFANQTSGTCCCNCNNRSQLNIIYILADDLGWNEVSAHGNNQACTPNIDALMMWGTRFKYFYCHPQCTPSRSALMTGKYAQKLGMQNFVILGAEPRCLPLTEKLLPQYLKDLGYATYHIGKWHLGSCANACRPLQRGFDFSKGFSNGKTDYYDCTYKENSIDQPGKSYHGFNCFKGNEHCYNDTGKYLTDVYTDEAVRIIKSHNCSSKPFFLYLAHLAIHAANNYWSLRAKQKDINKFLSCLKDKNRVNLTAMAYALDRSVGKIFKALYETGQICNTIVIFTSDNGGTRSPLEYTYGTNCPLRGEKMTAWEGGVRLPAAIWNPCLNSSLQGKTYEGYFHCVDWIKTLVCGAAKGNCSVFKNSSLDGKNLWPHINTLKPKRKRICHLTDFSGFKFAAITYGNWKLVCSGSFPALPQNCMCGMCGRGPRQCTFCNENKTANSMVAKAISSMTKQNLDECAINDKRNEYTIKCNSTILPNQACANCSCLFNIKYDPCENVNLAAKYPQKLAELTAMLGKYCAEKPSLNRKSDDRADPKYYDCTWTNWCDINNVTIN